MNYIILDMEWNQPYQNEPADPILKHGEIIQIGFFVLNEKLEITHSEEIMIRPVRYRVMNKYVKSLTGICQKDIRKGISFAAAVKILSGYFTEDTVIMTWSKDDIVLLKDNLLYHSMYDAKLPQHYDLQRIYAMQHEPVICQRNLKAAMENLGIEVDIQAHDAINDAFMTVLVARKLDLKRGIDEYGKNIADAEKGLMPWQKTQPLYSLSTDFSGSAESMPDACRKIDLTCPGCGRRLILGPLSKIGSASFVSTPICAYCERYFILFEMWDGSICSTCYKCGKELKSFYKSKLNTEQKRKKYSRYCGQIGREKIKAAQ